jgi:hypothetical protein
MARRSGRLGSGSETVSGAASKFGGVSGVVGGHSVTSCAADDSSFFCVLSRLFSSVFMIIILVALVVAIIFGGRWVYKNYVKKGR